MIFEKQSFEILTPEGYNLDALKKHVEICGRTCYKSLDKITEDSAEKFVQRMIDSKHYSTLEHAPVYLKYPRELYNTNKYADNAYSKVSLNFSNGYFYVSTNLRVIYENGWENDLKYICEPTIHHEKRHTVRLNTCIHVYKDLTRHRKMSFSIESTRYCNYAKDKFGGELKFILPSWLSSDKYEGLNEDERIFWRNLEHTEFDYLRLIEKGWQPQQAAEILPQCTAAEVIMSGFESDWDFIFRLRSDIAETGQPHPLVKDIINPLFRDFKKREWTNL